MTAQDKLNRSARAHGWANWSEVLMHNAPPHVINLIVDEAMREPVNAVENREPEPALTWRPGARVLITRHNSAFSKGAAVYVHRLVEGFESSFWLCGATIDCNYEDTRIVHESDAVVVG